VERPAVTATLDPEPAIGSPGPPLAAEALALGRALQERVVPLGAADLSDGGTADEHADHRAAARVHLAADAVLVGPWGGADRDDPPCGACLAIRWQRLGAASVRDALEVGGAVRRTAPWPPPTAFVQDATRALLYAALQRAGRAPAQVTRLDLATLRCQTAELLPEPLCPRHDTPPPPRAVRMVPRPKPAPGADRLRSAAGYDLPAQALANPVCGVLGPGIAHDLFAPTTASVSGHYFERARDGLHDIGWSGKADSFAVSRDLAFLEGLERYAGTRPRGDRSVVVGSLTSLGEVALDPRDCGEYPAATYDRDPSLRRFSPDETLRWVWGHSLRDDRPVLVPERSVYYSVGSAVDDFVFECSNGCATGSCLEEAALFGLLELVERDAFLLGWYAGAPATEIELATVPGVRPLLDRADLHGYDVHVFDSRVDLATPVATALAVRRDRGPGTLAFAAGAALDPARAVAAALGESLTYLPHLRHEARLRHDDLEAMVDDFERVVDLRDHALLFTHPSSVAHARHYLAPARRVTFDEAFGETAPRGDLLDDLHDLVRQVAAAGCDVIVVDQTTPEQARLGLHTVRTLAPGLLPIDFGWGRQRALAMPRLRTAHRRAGLLASDLSDADLHRVPHPFP
jgi:ribosomal protein S12 methylthiotransferase accessory factor